MYNKFFGFKEKPFKLVPNPEYLFLSKSHEEALAHLTYAISHGDGFVEITGEVGTGKTTLCRVFLGSLDTSIEAAYIFNPKLDALQLLKAINDEFGIDSKPDNTKDLIDILNEFLIEKKAAGHKVLVLIDEAQNLSLEVLEQLRLLSNLETTQEKLLQIILVGQPELGAMLSSHQLRQLGQRITINCQLDPLTPQETMDYIRHRISLASHRAGPPFEKASYRAIYEYSQGIPRLINIACDRVLLNAFGRNSFKITGSITKEAIKELTQKKSGRSSGWLQDHPGLVITSSVFIPLAIIMLYLFYGQPGEAPLANKPIVSSQVTGVQNQEAIPQIKQDTDPPEPIAPQASEINVLQDEAIMPSPPRKAQEAGYSNEKEEMASAEITEQSGHIQKELSQPPELLENNTTNDTPAEIDIHTVQVRTFQSESEAADLVAELKALGYPGFMYMETTSSGQTQYIVAAGSYQSYSLAEEAGLQLFKEGHHNFVARARDSLAAAAAIAAKEPPAGEDAINFLNYLKSLNSRHSRNSSMEETLKLWFPAKEIPRLKSRIEYDDPAFFQKTAKQYNLQVQPVATDSDMTLIQNLNLPVIFTFYLPGHSWPKYLAVPYIDKEKIYFIAGEHNQLASVARDIFLQYWSGEAYIAWKNFNELAGIISERSKGHDIKSLKNLLLQIGYENILLTENYDTETMIIVQSIQEKYGLQVDGMVGPFTKIALYNESHEFVKPSLVKFVGLVDKGTK